jgi:hypothetical protein
VITASLARDGRLDEARRIDRIAFPIGLITVTVATLVV